MTGIQKLRGALSFTTNQVDVGELVLSDKIYFRYYPEFIERKLEISPFKLPLSDQTLVAPKEPFEGIFGVFNDSLPDGWGRLLQDRKLSDEGINIHRISPLDRLSLIGKNGSGALCYYPVNDSGELDVDVDLDQVSYEINQLLTASSGDYLDELLSLGGSSGGARPKINILYNPETGDIVQDTREFHKGYEPWIIKSPSSSDPTDIAQIEYAYYLMAIDAGIEMQPSKLFETKLGNVFFGTKRFDLSCSGRLHMHSASGLMHDNFRLSNVDYGHLMDCAFQLERHVQAYENVLRLAAFNVYAHNRDDHIKNFSFLMDASGTWRFAPAYDLTFSNSAYCYHSTMVEGESKNPGTSHLLQLAHHFGVRKPELILEKVRSVVADWGQYAQKAHVSGSMQNLIQKALNEIP